MALRAPGGAEWAGGYGGIPGTFRDTTLLSPSSATHATLIAANAIEQRGRESQAEWKQTGARGEQLIAKGQQMFNEDMVRQISMLSNKFNTDIAIDVNGVGAAADGTVNQGLADPSGLIDGQAQEIAGGGMSGIRNRKGMDAIGSTMEFQQRWGGRIDDYVKQSGLDGKYADALRAQLYGDVSVTTRAVAAHEAAQRQVAYDEMNKLTMDAEGEKARLMGIGDTWNIHQIRGMIDNATAKLSVNIKASGPEERKQKLQQASVFLFGKYLDGLIITNPKAAEDILTQVHADYEGKKAAGIEGQPGQGPLMPPEQLDHLLQKARMVRIDRVTSDLVKSTEGMTKAKRDIIIEQRGEEEGFLAGQVRSIKAWADAEEAQARQRREQGRIESERAMDEKAGRLLSQKGADALPEIQQMVQNSGLSLTKKAQLMSTVQHLKSGLEAEDVSFVVREQLMAKAMVPGMIQNLHSEVLDNPLIGTKSKKEITQAYYHAQGQSYAHLQTQAGKTVAADIAKVQEVFLKDVLAAGDKGKSAYGVTWNQGNAAGFVTWATDAVKNAKDATEAAHVMQKGLAQFGGSGFMGGPNITRAEFELAAEKPFLITDPDRLKKVQEVAKSKIPQDVFGTVESIFNEENKARLKSGKMTVPLNGATLYRLYESGTPSEWQAAKKKRSLSQDAPASSARVTPSGKAPGNVSSLFR